MSNGRRHRRVRERDAIPDWALELGFWLPIVALAGYLGWVHRAHAWGVLQWILVVAALLAIAGRVLRRPAAKRPTNHG